MRVEKINFYTNCTNNYKSNKANPSMYASQDLVVFKGGKEAERPSFTERLKGLFKKPELSPEEKASEDIKYHLGAIESNLTQASKQGKYQSSIAKNIVEIGSYSNFKGYIDYDKKKSEKMVFGEIDESTGIPSYASIVDVKNGLKVQRQYDFINGLDLFSVKILDEPEYDVSMQFAGKKLLHYQEANRETGLIRELYPTKEGFYYFEGEKDNEGNITKIITECDFAYNEDIRSSYKKLGDDGVLREYQYIKETDLWEEVK